MIVPSMKHRIIGLFGVFLPLALLGAVVPTHCPANSGITPTAVVAPVPTVLSQQAVKAAQTAVPTPVVPRTRKPAAG